MSHWKRFGGATVPKGQRSKINAELELQGYGPDMFSVPLGPETGGGITHYGCMMPFDISAYTNVDKFLKTNNGEWVKDAEDDGAGAAVATQYAANKRWLAVLRLLKHLVIKRA